MDQTNQRDGPSASASMKTNAELAPMHGEIDLSGNAVRDLETPLLRRVDHALGMLRTYLVECAAQDEWSEQRSAQLTEVVRACVRQMHNHSTYERPLGEARLSRPVLRQVVRFVNEHLDSKLKWDDIADEIGMQPRAFGRRFKLSTGLTVRQYVIRCRLRHAMNLILHSKFGLSDVALEVGFSCQSHMTTLFRKHLGTTPGAFRMGSFHPAKSRAAEATTSENGMRSPGALAPRRFAKERLNLLQDAF